MMLDLSLVDLRRYVPRPGARKVGGPNPERVDRTPSVRSGAGGLTAANADGDRVEISGQGHRLQVEARIREAVVSELRTLASEARASADGEGA